MVSLTADPTDPRRPPALELRAWALKLDKNLSIAQVASPVESVRSESHNDISDGDGRRREQLCPEVDAYVQAAQEGLAQTVEELSELVKRKDEEILELKRTVDELKRQLARDEMIDR